MDQLVARSRVDVALESLATYDDILLEYDVGERTIAAKLAQYLQGVFPGHDVDVEYNRHGLDPKRVGLPVGCHQAGDALVVPDIVVHRRGHDRDNLLVIELKKTTNRDPRDCDQTKVLALKGALHYEFGITIEIPTGPARGGLEVVQEWF